MPQRQAVRAGMFYESSPDICRRDAEVLIGSAELPGDLPARLYGGLAPHAGWAYSGRLAAMTLKALLGGAGQSSPPTVVLFGADHTGEAKLGEVWDSGAWLTPLGEVEIDEALAAELLEADGGEGLLRSNPAAHEREHSLEVQLPLLKVLAPAGRIVPIAVPPASSAVQIGRVVGEVLAAATSGQVCVVGSTDLTHHGGHFGSPGGHGEKSEAYARRNDRRILDLIEVMDAEAIIPEARSHMNACGAGAIAATIAAVRQMGALAGSVLAYTNSYQVVHEKAPYELDDTTVGYASVVFA